MDHRPPDSSPSPARSFDVSTGFFLPVHPPTLPEHLHAAVNELKKMVMLACLDPIGDLYISDENDVLRTPA